MGRLKNLVKILSLLLIVGGNFLPTTVTAQKLRVDINKTQVIELNQPATVVSVANPNIADVTVQSPRVILVVGKLGAGPKKGGSSAGAPSAITGIAQK
jgi:Flp pilus assembly secretin CpaC